ncbi:MAG: dUTP diphosphatase [Thermovirgaceae bacterium]|jgi:dUTP pyrophosphatase|nr:dUTP diphosphatase [Synergistales bacterium]MDI9392816.1 dUTP diphosphatase [Synergistota bacterium]MDY0178499.1 dUTP diphosphatase [Synergistaceae bacterium]HRW87596.1 dUTP diphosphatase [Thermovirgaceae bacterium]MDD3133102.1 dUTP diphosphatase [Synergistales bacterium]
MQEVVRLGIFRDDEDIALPVYATPFSSGVDLRSNERVTIPAGGRSAVGTGIRLEIPEGYECQVRPRSGLALKNGVTVLNAPGTIDADYRGEVRVILVNLGENPFEIEKGDRIAQMILAPVSRIEWEETDSLSETDRGSGGFGSTGR